MPVAARIRDEVRSYCPIPADSRTVHSAQEARETLLAPRFTTLRETTSTDVYRDESLDFATRRASFYNSWPMYSEGRQHQALRRLTRQIVTSGSQEALAQVDYVLARALTGGDRDGAPFDWVARVAVPVSTAVVGGLVGRLLDSAPTEELVALGGALMLSLSGLEPGPARERAALEAGVRLADLAEQHRDELDAALDTAGMSSELIGGALAQVVTGALDPLQAAVASVPLHPGMDARAVIAAATPFRFVQRIDTHAADRSGVRIPLMWPEPDELPFGFGPHRCTAAGLTEKVVEQVVAHVARLAPTLTVVAGAIVPPAAFLRFEDLWVSHE